MAKDILKPEVKMTGLMDMALIGLTKTVTEQAMIPIIGNGTFTSGGIKLVAGALVQGKGKIGNVVGSAILLDAVDDLAVAVMQNVGFGKGPTGDDWD